jgi:cytochrome c oxidase subunit IV
MSQNETEDRQRNSALTWRLWKGPGLTWLALVALFAVSLGSAYLPLGAGNLALNLLIAIIMIGLLVIFLMDLKNAKTIIRVVAAAGLFWTIFMFALIFNDYLSRTY